MSKYRSYIYLLGLTALITVISPACSGDKESRPSPLTVDSTTIDNIFLKITYSSPSVRERKIWDELVPYNQIWRTGANEASYIEVSSDVTINDQVLPKGKYAIFTIPTDSTWTIIFNKEWDQWGAYNYNPEQDIFRLDVLPESGEFSEKMRFMFEKNLLVFKWENLHYSLKVSPL